MPCPLMATVISRDALRMCRLRLGRIWRVPKGICEACRHLYNNELAHRYRRRIPSFSFCCEQVSPWISSFFAWLPPALKGGAGKAGVAAPCAHTRRDVRPPFFVSERELLVGPYLLTIRYGSVAEGVFTAALAVPAGFDELQIVRHHLKRAPVVALTVLPRAQLKGAADKIGLPF